MAAIAASVQGATITIASVAAMAAPTPAKKIAAMAAPTPAKKLAAMAAIEKTPCGSRHGGD